MTLVRLLYTSYAGDDLNWQVVMDILQHAEAANKARDVTGCLLFQGRWFLQALEGEGDTVNRLYASIMADSRHYDLCLLRYGPVATRLFGEWHMKGIRLDRMPPSPLPVLQPEQLRQPPRDPDAALMLFHAAFGP